MAPDPLVQLVRNAALFAQADDILIKCFEVEHGKFVPNAPFPVFSTLATLSLELYLKALCVIETGKHPKTHDYEKLVCALPGTTQREIIAAYEALLVSDPDWRKPIEEHRPGGFGLTADFWPMLSLHRDAFTRWRYAHEENDEPISWFAHPLIGILLRAILHRKPDFGKIVLPIPAHPPANYVRQHPPAPTPSATPPHGPPSEER